MDKSELPAALSLLHNALSSDTQPQAHSGVLPSPSTLSTTPSLLISSLPTHGLGLTPTTEHLLSLLPSLNASSTSPNYYGFVTGGSTPAASIADNIVTATDQNVQVHLPGETAATVIEDRALEMLCQLLQLKGAEWTHRTFTTGATASNVLGLACGRDGVVMRAWERSGEREDGNGVTIAEYGVVEALRRVGLKGIQVLTTVPHSSLGKAASIVGLGRGSVKLVGREGERHRFDFEKVEEELKRVGWGSIVAVSCGEVNTGFYATDGLEDMRRLRQLCDQYGAWIHVDGAFGLMARVLMSPSSSERKSSVSDLDCRRVIQCCEGIELADSITGDGHKLLNVPYDCGFFLSKHRNVGEEVFQNANAAYLKASGPASIASPLNIGIENSRRFRALPVYATLAAYGLEGYRDMLFRQVQLTRKIAEYIIDSPDYVLLPDSHASKEQRLQDIFIIVLFRAKDDGLNSQMVELIKGTSKVYVSGTSWDGKPAARFAVSNWQADVTRDLLVITGVLEKVVQTWKRSGNA